MIGYTVMDGLICLCFVCFTMPSVTSLFCDVRLEDGITIIDLEVVSLAKHDANVNDLRRTIEDIVNTVIMSGLIGMHDGSSAITVHAPTIGITKTFFQK